MTRPLISAVAVVMLFAATTPSAAVAGQDQCPGVFVQCYTIPPDRYPDGCHPNGWALKGGQPGEDLVLAESAPGRTAAIGSTGTGTTT
jgi:hypothetical protein